MSDQIPKIKTSGVSTTHQVESHSVAQRDSDDARVNAVDDETNEEKFNEEEIDEEENIKDEKSDRPNPHFDAIDIMFYMLLAIVGDVFDGVWITRIFFAPTTLLFLYFKGVDQMISRNAVSQFAELVPVLGWLPISTSMAVYTIMITNHPEYFEKLGGASEVLKKVSKKKIT